MKTTGIFISSTLPMGHVAEETHLGPLFYKRKKFVNVSVGSTLVG